MAYVFTSSSAAQAAQAQIDTAEGYPRAGVDVGAGIHVVPPFVTTHHVVPLKHPTLQEWAIAEDARVDAAISGKGGIPAPTTLDASWGISASAQVM